MLSVEVKTHRFSYPILEAIASLYLRHDFLTLMSADAT